MGMRQDKVKALAEKWYKKLNFETKYDELFYELLNSVDGFKEISIFDFDLEANKEKHPENAIWALYFCEEASEIFAKRGISEQIILDTLWDIQFRIARYTDRVGKMGLDKLSDWLFLHLKAENIKLGRLQYQIKKTWYEAPEHGLHNGDNVLAVHIPWGEKLTKESALESFGMAEDFFAKYFPDYDYKAFTCSSWLLDKTLHKFLKPGSNILDFQSIFDIISLDPCDDAFKFAFPHGITRENVKDFVPETSLQYKIKDYVLDGGVLYMGNGIHKKSKT